MMIQDRADIGLDALAGTSFRMMVNGSQTPGLAQVFTTFTTRVPQLFVDVDRVKAKSMNVALSDVNDTLQVYLGSLYVNDFNRFGRTYQATAAGTTALLIFPLCILLVCLPHSAESESTSLSPATILIVPMCLLCG